MMDRVLLIGFILAFTLTCTSTVFAAKKRVRSAGAPVASGASYSSARLNRAGRSVVITFHNLKSVKRIEYALSYTANGMSQGAMGSFVPSGQATDTRDLYFGTCSHGVCTPHYGIRGASVIVTTTLTNGSVNTKRYVIKSI